MKLLKKIISEISRQENFIFVSIGANDGIFVDEVYQSNLLNKDWKSYFVEPVPQTYEKLVKNYNNLYQNNNFVFENVAISNVEGYGYLITELVDDSMGMCSFFRRPTETSIKIPVIQTTMKSFLEKHNIKKIDFLKVDCEGMDYEIILQTLELGINPQVILFEEIHLENFNNLNIRTHKDFYDFINKSNFILIDDIPEYQYEDANKLLIRSDLSNFINN
jgi:FkbM family methyltransferase